jgi:hypothetical protein
MLHCYLLANNSFVYRQVDISHGVEVIPGTLNEDRLRVTIFPKGASTSSKDTVTFTVDFDQSVPAGEEYAAALAVMSSLIRPGQTFDPRVCILVRRRVTPIEGLGPQGLYEAIYGFPDQTWWTTQGAQVMLGISPRKPRNTP